MRIHPKAQRQGRQGRSILYSGEHGLCPPDSGPEGHGHFFPCCMEVPWCTYSALDVLVSMCSLVDITVINVGQKGAGSLDE